MTEAIMFKAKRDTFCDVCKNPIMQGQAAFFVVGNPGLYDSMVCVQTVYGPSVGMRKASYRPSVTPSKVASEASDTESKGFTKGGEDRTAAIERMHGEKMVLLAEICAAVQRVAEQVSLVADKQQKRNELLEAKGAK